jgi:hypothetical protein
VGVSWEWGNGLNGSSEIYFWRKLSPLDAPPRNFFGAFLFHLRGVHYNKNGSAGLISITFEYHDGLSHQLQYSAPGFDPYKGLFFVLTFFLQFYNCILKKYKTFFGFFLLVY